MFERFTDRARRSLALADQEAELAGHDTIGTGHLLAGLIREGEALAFTALHDLGVTLEAAREAIGRQHPAGDASAGPGLTVRAFTPRMKKALELAVRESVKLGHNYVATGHLLLGLVEEGHGAEVPTLEAAGFTDAGAVRQKILRLLGGERVISQEQFEKELYAPLRRWEEYLLGEPAGMEKDERQRLASAARIVEDALGVSPRASVVTGGAARKGGVTVADVIAAVVLKRELWEPGLWPGASR